MKSLSISAGRIDSKEKFDSIMKGDFVKIEIISLLPQGGIDCQENFTFCRLHLRWVALQAIVQKNVTNEVMRRMDFDDVKLR